MVLVVFGCLQWLVIIASTPQKITEGFRCKTGAQVHDIRDMALQQLYIYIRHPVNNVSEVTCDECNIIRHT